jgi:hypothetical protein
VYQTLIVRISRFAVSARKKLQQVAKWEALFQNIFFKIFMHDVLFFDVFVSNFNYKTTMK